MHKNICSWARALVTLRPLITPVTVYNSIDAIAREAHPRPSIQGFLLILISGEGFCRTNLTTN